MRRLPDALTGVLSWPPALDIHRRRQVGALRVLRCTALCCTALHCTGPRDTAGGPPPAGLLASWPPLPGEALHCTQYTVQVPAELVASRRQAGVRKRMLRHLLKGEQGDFTMVQEAPGALCDLRVVLLVGPAAGQSTGPYYKHPEVLPGGVRRLLSAWR